MYMKQLLILAGLFCSILLLACSERLYKPVEANTAKHGVPLADLQKGRALYVRHCAGCHNLHAPSTLSAEKWRTQMQEMQIQAKISDTVRDLIYNYLISE